MADTDNSTSALEMSDEDFLQMDPSEFEYDQDDNSSDEDANENPDTSEAESEESDEDASADDSDVTDDDEEEDSEEQNIDEDADDDDNEDEDADEDEDDTKLTNKEALDYEAIGKQLMGEFKANGRMIQPKTAEDAIQLMQMGANYHKKMIGLKPSLKVLKLLEKNGLMDPEKLNYLIDLHQNNPEAITQLLKNSDIDPMEIDLDAENNYTPQKRSVDDAELLLDQTLESISDSPEYQRTLTVLGDDWDNASRQIIADSPAIIATINAHMESGIFDQVAEHVAYERSLGKLQGVNDFEAYQQTGDYMDKNKLFTPVEQPGAALGEALQNQQDPNQRPNNDQLDAKRKTRKQAASPSRQGNVKKGSNNENYSPLEMSDEEFIKLNQLNL